MLKGYSVFILTRISSLDIMLSVVYDYHVSVTAIL